MDARKEDDQLIMDSPWWATISTKELLGLRHRLLQQLQPRFHGTLGSELEDVIQQAFVVLFRRRESIDSRDDGLFRYLQRVARNNALDRIKSRKRSEQHASVAIAHVRGNSATGATLPLNKEQLQENRRILEVFCALGELDRLLIWRYVVDEKPIRAIARDCDLNWHRVAGMIEAALRKFRRELTDPFEQKGSIESSEL